MVRYGISDAVVRVQSHTVLSSLPLVLRCLLEFEFSACKFKLQSLQGAVCNFRVQLLLQRKRVSNTSIQNIQLSPP